MFQKILVLAPHIDDGELGCGGVMSKTTENKKEIFYTAFSAAEKSVPPEFNHDILKHEMKSAASVLGIKPSHLTVENFPVREFPAYRQEILEKMIEIRSEINPDLVLLPSPKDIHQDHYTIAVEGIRAFKMTNILGYEMPWNNLGFHCNCFFPLSFSHVQRKIEAVQCYKSQSHRNYSSEESIWGLARTRGTQSGVDYAEAFEIIRFYVKSVQ